jgi:predicted DNA-binding protein (UPF0251 family)/predicted Fe-Mo cluster-binding NifX family protein
MPRPRKCRRVRGLPGITYYKPQGLALRRLEETRLGVEEAEALRLKDLEGLNQREAAERMGVSRPTFQRVLKEARRHAAEALLGGRAIRIEGGHFAIAGAATAERTTEETMNIAIVTDDGRTVSGHFGRATGYAVYTVENSTVTGRELREKAGHHTFAGQGDEPDHDESGRHGFGAGAQSRHAAMAATIGDCQVLISGGMGQGAYNNLKEHGIEPIITDETDIEGAVERYLAGDLPNLMDRLH